LPQHKREAIHKVGFGVMNKIVLQFPSMFWNSTIEGIGFVSDVHGEFNFFLNLYPFLNQPILMCFVAADFAHEMEKWSDQQIIARIVEILNKTHGNQHQVVPEPVKYKITRWYSDPYSRGSYSFMKVGSTMNDVNTLAEPVGRLHFAGEATFVYPGYTHGGYMSGKREAKRVIALIKEQQQRQQQQQEAITRSLENLNVVNDGEVRLVNRDDLALAAATTVVPVVAGL
jgi:monoamine oxidase